MIHLYLHFPLLQEIQGARKFKHSGIDLALCCKYDIMFTNIVTTSQYAWAPSQGLNSDDDGLGERRKNASNEDSYLEEVVVIQRRILYQIL